MAWGQKCFKVSLIVNIIEDKVLVTLLTYLKGRRGILVFVLFFSIYKK